VLGTVLYHIALDEHSKVSVILCGTIGGRGIFDFF